MIGKLELRASEADNLRWTLARLLAVLGQAGTCERCGKPIVWMHRILSGKRIAYDADGMAHCATCQPKA